MSFRDLFDLPDDAAHAVINFDNAATTPPLIAVNEAIQKALPYYSSIGRGIGQNSDYSTMAYGKSKRQILDFLNLSHAAQYTVIYTKNTTEGINLLAHTLIQDKSEKVLISRMEHHSNDLPWRHKATPIYADVDALGRITPAAIKACLENHNGSIKWVCITAASNVTGYKNPIHDIAKLAHGYGAKIIVDAAQLIAHEPIDMLGSSPDEAIDFLVFSGHKMYAPYGMGAVVGHFPDSMNYPPFVVGGGTVSHVDDTTFALNRIPQCFEGGTQNLLGAIAIDVALTTLQSLGFPAIISHETQLKNYLMTQLSAMDHVVLYGDATDTSDRVGIIPFNIKGKTYMETALILAEQHGIATRCGKFCAHPYVERLFNQFQFDTDGVPLYYGEKGLVRISLGLYNTLEEADKFLNIISCMG
ncbi:MAG: aminotransferase class V-fold PLP-dependent enzyme [Cellulosilyticaceae bacterium]